MLRFFQNNNILMFILFPLLAGLFSSAIPKTLINNITAETQILFYKQLLLIIQGSFFVVFYKVLSALFLMLNGIIFNRLVISSKICKPNNYYIGFVFLIFLGLSSSLSGNLSVLIALFFFLLALNIIFKTLRKQVAIFDFLNAGMLISIGFLFWVNTVFLILVVFFGLFVLRTGQWRELASSAIGLLLPFFIFSSVYFFIFSNFDFFYDVFKFFSEKSESANYSTYQIIAGSYISFFSLISTLQIIGRFKTFEADTQDYYKIFFFIFLLSAGICFLKPDLINNILPILAVALTIPFGRFFINIKKRLFAELLFTIFLLITIIISVNYTF
ncbi:MAG: hypothetical protein L3J35_04695 [Bacteroidales bacterium]|nr:hypothetical protein [Bacteroidales bacterium]